MFRGKVTEKKVNHKLQLEIELGIGFPGQLVSTRSFVVDTGATTFLVREEKALVDYYFSGGRVVDIELELADGSKVYKVRGFSNLRVGNLERFHVPTDFLGETDLVGTEFLRGLNLTVDFRPGAEFVAEPSGDWLQNQVTP
jgi:hypothetical protein